MYHALLQKSQMGNVQKNKDEICMLLQTKSQKIIRKKRVTLNNVCLLIERSRDSLSFPEQTIVQTFETNNEEVANEVFEQ